MADHFTIHVTSALTPQEVHAVSVGGKETVGTLKEKVACILGVRPEVISLHHEGCVFRDMAVEVAGTVLVEGSEVEAGVEEKHSARETLRAMGVSLGDVGLRTWIGSERTDSDAVQVAQLMLDVVKGPFGGSLCVAALKGLIETAILLSSRGVDPRHCSGRTPLHYAVSGGHLPIVQHLVEAGANPASRDDYSRTPLDVAEQRGHMDIIDYLTPLLP